MTHADRIILRGMQFFAYHGMNPEEKKQGQSFIVDVEMTLDVERAGREDAIAHTVDYAKVYADVRDLVTGARYGLIERLAYVVATQLLRRYPLDEVLVRVHKPEAPLPGAFADVVVEMRRRAVDVLQEAATLAGEEGR
jgi:dihydroneopterin aldolase